MYYCRLPPQLSKRTRIIWVQQAISVGLWFAVSMAAKAFVAPIITQPIPCAWACRALPSHGERMERSHYPELGWNGLKIYLMDLAHVDEALRILLLRYVMLMIHWAAEAMAEKRFVTSPSTKLLTNHVKFICEPN